MQEFKFHRKDLHLFGEHHLNLVYHQSHFSNLINRPFAQEEFANQIVDKTEEFSQEKRIVLVSALKKQYENVKDKSKVLGLIESLRNENTFTVTTGHQLSLFTGPLFFVIKILQVIKQAEKLNLQFPEMNFVPVYWMATEDHDFEEIQRATIFSDELTWESSQDGPVGRFNLEGLELVKERISELYGNNPDSEIHGLIESYDGANLTEATRNLVQHLFQDFGLVIIDGDDALLKAEFAPVMKKELETSFSLEAVEKANTELEMNGGKVQVHAREINLFLIEDGFRARIEKKSDGYFVEGKGDFSQKEIIEMLSENPEKFSPNVVLRPLYQETILPNLAYIGGGGEIAYWLQLKGVFDAMNTVYPLIVVRNSMMIVDANTHKKIENIELSMADVFEAADTLKRNYVEANAGEELNFNELDAALTHLIDNVTNQIEQVDPGMDKFAAAEVVRLQKQIDSIKDKLVKRSKGKHDGVMKQIDQVKDRLFPNGKLQERTSNFFSFCPDGMYSNMLKELYSAIDPNEKDFIVVVEN